MVAAVHSAPGEREPQAVSAWLDTLRGTYPADDVASFGAADAYARSRASEALPREGEPAVARAEGTAAILAGLRLDAATIRAALLLGLPAGKSADAEYVGEHFGADVAALVSGVARMEEIRAAPAAGDEAERSAQAERLRKMLLAMVEDIRVVLIKLAERTAALRHLVAGGPTLAEPRARAAREVQDLFAPLANRLGVWQLKWELEDLALRALEPTTYKSIATMLDERRADRERYIEGVINVLRVELKEAGLRAEVSGRPKHIYSIWNKMRRKEVGIDALHDIRAVRILVPDVRDCYAALGVVHHLWTPVPGEFDDYIARPKANSYRSLHTAVTGPEGKVLEVQIRTFDMHQHSEYGVAAHWRYKEGAQKGVRRDPGFEDRLAWLRQVLDWKDAVAGSSDALAAFRTSLFTDTIYVLTPQGKVVDLPKSATPVDFAYAVHTSLGHRCRGARVNGAMVPLNHVLRNGDRVEIIAAKQGGPSRDWVNPDLGYVTSHRARTKVRQWFKAQQQEETIAHGRAIVERELARAGATAVNLDTVAAKAGYERADDLFAAVGREETNLRQIQTAIKAVVQPVVAPAAEPEAGLLRQSKATGAGSGILVVGVDRLMTVLAKCCKPAPPDPIVGFVTRGKGVTIHRQSCQNVVRLRAREPERLITADWGARRDEVFPVDVVLEAADRQGLLRDVSEIFSRERINVTAANTLTRDMRTRMAFTLEVRSLDALTRALALVRDVPGVVAATRR
jgi:GTP pyrophosphokinase